MGEHIYWVLPKMGAYMGRLHTKRFKVYKRVGISRRVRKSQPRSQGSPTRPTVGRVGENPGNEVEEIRYFSI